MDGTEHNIDRVYIDVAHKGEGEVEVHPGNYRYRLQLINREGFRDLGVCNPHEGLAIMEDQASEASRHAYRHFISFTSGALARPITCAPPCPIELNLIVASLRDTHAVLKCTPHLYCFYHYCFKEKARGIFPCVDYGSGCSRVASWRRGL